MRGGTGLKKLSVSCRAGQATRGWPAPGECGGAAGDAKGAQNGKEGGGGLVGKLIETGAEE